MSASDHNPISPWQEFIAQASELQILQKKMMALLASPYKAYFYQPQNIPKLPCVAQITPNEQTLLHVHYFQAFWCS